MEKINLGNKKNIEIKVQFEYLNNNDILDLSKEFRVKISLDDETDFETNKQKILSEANFKTKNERNNYHMFNKVKKKFFTKNSDFEPYIKTKSPIVLINCYEYCHKTIDKLNEDINIFSNKSKNINMNEIKKKEFINELACLENNFEVDLFSDEFIFKNGMEILLNIIKENFGDIRNNTLKCINKLLSFESAFEFFTNNEKNLRTLYTVFIENNESICILSFYDIMIKLIGGNEEKTMALINMCNEYFYKKMIKYLGEENKDNDSKNYILLFINMILNYSNKNKQFELIKEITKSGIFDNLNIILKNYEDFFSEQIELFETTFSRIIEETENKDNKEYENITKNFNNFIENKKIYHIQNLILKTNSEDEEIKTEAINKLNNIITENNNDLDLIYEAYIKNDNLDQTNLFYNYFILLFKTGKNNFAKFINSVKKYTQSKKSKLLNELLQMLTNKKSPNIKLKIDALSFINNALSTLLKTSNDDDYLELLYILTDNGIFEYLEKNSEKEEKLIQEILKFKEIVEKNLSKVDQNSEQKYQIIKEKFRKLNEKKIMNEFTELLLKLHNTTSLNHAMIENQLLDKFKDENNFKIFFKMFAENEIKNLYFSFFEVFTQYCIKKDENCIKFIQMSDEYKKLFKIDCFDKIINYLDEYQNELVQIKALNLVNTLLGIKDKKLSYNILNKFNKLGIFEYLTILVKSKEKEQEMKIQIGISISFIGLILKENKKEKEKEKDFVTINKKYIKLKEMQDLYDSTINDFVI